MRRQRARELGRGAQRVIHDRGQVLAGRFRVRKLPATFVASPDGNIRWVGGAGQHGGELSQAVRAATAQAQARRGL